MSFICGSRFSRRPVERLSSAMASWPAASSVRIRWEPMNPAPPVTSIFMYDWLLWYLRCLTDRLKDIRLGDFRLLDRFLLMYTFIITLHPPCLPSARTHSVKFSVNICCSVRPEGFRPQISRSHTILCSLSLTSDFSTPKSLLRKSILNRLFIQILPAHPLFL